jgi:hypothetical protein
LDHHYTLKKTKKEGQEGKVDLFQGWKWEEDEHKERGNESECGRCTLYPYYESRRMKLVEIILTNGRERENNGGGKSN